MGAFGYGSYGAAFLLSEGRLLTWRKGGGVAHFTGVWFLFFMETILFVV